MNAVGSDQIEYLDQLIASIKLGDTDALSSLYHLCATAVYAYCFSILKNREDAEDVLQDCFISIYENAHQYHSAGKPMAWILTVAKNLCLMQMRKRGKAASTPLDECLTTMVADNTDPTDQIILEHCVRQLTDQERQIVVLHAVVGWKHREIAAFLGMHTSTVLSKYHRSIEKLKKFI